jgi:hypothetical protein
LFSIVISTPDSNAINTIVAMTETIPGPRGLPILGNILDLQDPEAVPIHAVERLIDIYGQIYKFRVGKRNSSG